MLPFSGIGFFYWVLISAGLMHLFFHLVPGFKPRAARLYLGLSLVYLVFIFPEIKPLFLFLAWVVSWLWLSLRPAFRVHSKWFIIPILLPLLLSKIGETASLVYFTGLSYISFRALQVYLDREQMESDWRLSDLIFFLAYPPAILMGPIDRYRNFKKHLNEIGAHLNARHLSRGLMYALQGGILKFILADTIDMYWLPEYESRPDHFFIGEMYAYSLFLYFDFAGYSLMALGWSLMCGIPIPENFNFPFLSANIQDFWRRFHISLGDWLKDYFFKPIYKYSSSVSALKPHPLLRQNLALFLTFFLMGCWNGFKAPFIVSGSLFGLYSVIHNTWVMEQRKRDRIFFLSGESLLEQVLSVLLTLHAACFSLYIFGGHSPWF
jgi:membrane protein involved in D-alanine export